MSIEVWKSLFDLAAVVLLFLTFLAGAGALYTGSIINSRQEAKLRQFDSDLTKAKTDLAKQQERAAKAEGGIANAQAEAAKANKAAEDERLARIKIEDRLAWRRVDPGRYLSFIEELKPFKGSVVFLNPLGNGDPETDTFTEDIAKLLRDSSWEVRIGKGNTGIPAPRGLICRVDESTPAGMALAKVLGTLPTPTIIPTHLNLEVATITIGLKPPP